MNAASTRAEVPAGVLLGGFHQAAWVVHDLDAAERYFVETVGVPSFFRMEGIAAQDLNGTYRGAPGNWGCDALIGYHGELQIELIGNAWGESIFTDFLERSGPGLQHMGYIVESPDASRAFLQGSGYPLVQSFEPPGAKVAYHDTAAAIGIMTETIWLDDTSRALFERIKRGEF